LVEVIYREKPPNKLTEEQKEKKRKRSSIYEINHRNLLAEYKRGEIDKETFEANHRQQWDDFVAWCIKEGIYEEVTPEQQLAEEEANLQGSLDAVNNLRTELGKKKLKIVEE